MKRIALGAVTAVSALVLAACGSSSSDHGSSHAGASSASASTSASSAADHNAADVTFAQQMIPHHAQAIEMAKLAATRAQSADIKALAAQIEAAQQPEIDTMTGWLKSWAQSVPDTSTGSTSHDMGSMASSPASSMDMGSMGSGMMSDADMAMLTKASGAEFDHHFLTMMVSHHQGAIAMAKTEQSSGSYGPAKDMANSIVTSQTAEIAKMQSVLKSMS